MILEDLRQLKDEKDLVEYFDTETGELQKRRPVERKQKYNRPHRRAGTFGDAGNRMFWKSDEISAEDNQSAIAALEAACAKQLKRKASSLSSKQQALRNAHIAWLNDKCSNWDLAVSLHLPSTIAHTKAVVSTTIIEKHIIVFFKKLEKKIFSRTERIRLKKKLSRLIVVENSTSVGFHIHMAMLLPEAMNLCRFIGILKEQWKRFWTGQTLTFSNEHAVWAEAMSGNYVNYSLKNVGTEQAEVLWCSSHL